MVSSDMYVVKLAAILCALCCTVASKNTTTPSDLNDTCTCSWDEQQLNDRFDALRRELRDELRSELKGELKKEMLVRGRRQSEVFAFTAYLDHEEHVHQGNTLKFNKPLYNAGQVYNPVTGIATIVQSGTYLFTVTIEHWQSSELVCTLVVDNADMVDLVMYPSGRSQQSTNTAILGLSQGQSVWVRTTDGTLLGGGVGHHYTTFAGVLLY